MKKIILFLIIMLLPNISWPAAWQDYGAFSGDIASGDDFLIRDLSQTPPANGTIERLAWSALLIQLANGADYWVGSAQAYLSNEIVVNNEETLYNALSDVDRFIEQGDADPEAGVDETTAGVQKIYGDNSTTGGGTEWHNPAGDKTNEEFWRCRAAGDDFECGPESDPDLFRFNRDGSISKVIDGSYGQIGIIAEDTTCSLDLVGKILYTPIVGDLGNTDVVFSTCIGGTLTEFMRFESDTGQWESNYPIDSVPMYVTTNDASVDLDTYSTNAYANTCRLEILLTNASPTLNLWNDSECGTTGRGKRVHILYRGIPGTFTVDADTADTFLMDVAGYTVAAGEAITTSQRGAYIELRGRDGGAYWDVINISPVAHWPDPSP